MCLDTVHPLPKVLAGGKKATYPHRPPLRRSACPWSAAPTASADWLSCPWRCHPPQRSLLGWFPLVCRQTLHNKHCMCYQLVIKGEWVSEWVRERESEWVCVCVHACTWLCVHVCMCVCARVCAYMHACVQVHECLMVEHKKSRSMEPNRRCLLTSLTEQCLPLGQTSSHAAAPGCQCYLSLQGMMAKRGWGWG